MGTHEQDLEGIGALADPTRRALYRLVCGRVEPVSREEAARALGITLHQAKFHLDRMEAEGLLEAGYARDAGRSGPGAGRPAKRYRRSEREFAVSLPEREYALAGRLMAAAIAESARTGAPVMQTLDRAAAAEGVAIGETTLEGSRPHTSPEMIMDDAEGALRRYGYEPHRDGDTITLANCPFHALVAEHPELVCQMNHVLLASLADRIGRGRLAARLTPGQDACCVVLSLPEASSISTG